MILYLIRHGETAWNTLGKLQGKTDIPLNEHGICLAEKTGKGLFDVPFDMAFTSPLKRAVETAEIIMGERKAPVIADKRIEEIGFGSYEGLVYTKEWSEIPDEHFSYFFTRPELYRAPKDGESFEELIERERDFLNELSDKEEYRDKTILISTHGAALAGLLCILKKQSVAHLWDCRLHRNCTFSVVEIRDQEVVILKEGVTLY